MRLLQTTGHGKRAWGSLAAEIATQGGCVQCRYRWVQAGTAASARAGNQCGAGWRSGPCGHWRLDERLGERVQQERPPWGVPVLISSGSAPAGSVYPGMSP